MPNFVCCNAKNAKLWFQSTGNAKCWSPNCKNAIQRCQKYNLAKLEPKFQGYFPKSAKNVKFWSKSCQSAFWVKQKKNQNCQNFGCKMTKMPNCAAHWSKGEKPGWETLRKPVENNKRDEWVNKDVAWVRGPFTWFQKLGPIPRLGRESGSAGLTHESGYRT